jgi:hypothetical protein
VNMDKHLMTNSRLIWLLYYIMALIVVLPGAFYLSRKVTGTTKIIWGLIWFSIFLCFWILYPYVSPLLEGSR